MNLNQHPKPDTDVVEDEITGLITDTLYYGIVGNHEQLMNTVGDILRLGNVQHSHDDLMNIAQFAYGRDALMSRCPQDDDPTLLAMDTHLVELCAMLAGQLKVALPKLLTKAASS